MRLSVLLEISAFKGYLYHLIFLAFLLALCFKINFIVYNSHVEDKRF